MVAVMVAVGIVTKQFFRSGRGQVLVAISLFRARLGPLVRGASDRLISLDRVLDAV